MSLLLILLSSQLYSEDINQDTYITYEFSGGRFGDNLLSYIICKYFSWKYGLTFLYRPFAWSDELYMHRLENSITNFDGQRAFKVAYRIEDYNSSNQLVKPTLYVSNLYSKNYDWRDYTELYSYIADHPMLHEEIKMMIAPIETMEFNLPQDRTSIAVHVRKGGGFDKPLLSGSSYNDTPDATKYADCQLPLKFPPDEFYIDQIRFISQLLEDRLLYVYIFSDDRHVPALVEKYQQAVNKKNIVFDYYKIYEPFNLHLIQDLFFMKEFDCLIRPDSSLSIVAQIIGDHNIVIWPTKSHWEGSTLIIDESVCAQKINSKLVQEVVTAPLLVSKKVYRYENKTSI